MVPGVGRPEIGPAFSVRFPEDLLERIDAATATVGVSRASWLRTAAEERLSYPRAALAVLADWMVREGMAGEVGYALERLDKHGDLLFCAQHGISGAVYDELAEARESALRHEDILPAGWALTLTTPVDFTVTCPHGVAAVDTEAGRTQDVVAAGCPEGCRDHYLSDLQAPLTGRGPTSSSPASAQVHQLRRPGHLRRR